MPKMIFRGCYIRDYDGRIDEGGQFVRIHLTADFSDKVREAMGWTIGEELESLLGRPDNKSNEFDRACLLLPANIKMAKLVGEIATTSMELVPNGELAKHQMDLDCSSIYDFELHRVKEDNGSFRRELRFTALVRKAGTAKKIEGYLEAVGDKVARVTVGYAKQDNLPGVGDEPKDNGQMELDTGCIACNNQIPLRTAVDGEPLTHDSGQPCTADASNGQAEAPGPVLASAREAAGGTHQRKKRGQSTTGIPADVH